MATSSAAGGRNSQVSEDFQLDPEILALVRDYQHRHGEAAVPTLRDRLDESFDIWVDPQGRDSNPRSRSIKDEVVEGDRVEPELSIEEQIQQALGNLRGLLSGYGGYEAGQFVNELFPAGADNRTKADYIRAFEDAGMLEGSGYTQSVGGSGGGSAAGDSGGGGGGSAGITAPDIASALSNFFSGGGNPLSGLNAQNFSDIEKAIGGLNNLSSADLSSELGKLNLFDGTDLSAGLRNYFGGSDPFANLDFFEESDLTKGLSEFFSGQGNPLDGLNNLGIGDINKALSGLDLFGGNDLSAGLSNYFGTQGNPLSGLSTFDRSDLFSGLSDFFNSQGNPLSGLNNLGMDDINRALSGLDLFGANDLSAGLSNYFGSRGNPFAGLESQMGDINDLISGLNIPAGGMSADDILAMADGFNNLSNLIGGIDPLDQTQVSDALRNVFQGDGNPLAGMEDRLANLGINLGGLDDQFGNFKTVLDTINKNVGGLNLFDSDDLTSGLGQFFAGDTQAGDPLSRLFGPQGFGGLYGEGGGIEEILNEIGGVNTGVGNIYEQLFGDSGYFSTDGRFAGLESDIEGLPTAIGNLFGGEDNPLAPYMNERFNELFGKVSNLFGTSDDPLSNFASKVQGIMDNTQFSAFTDDQLNSIIKAVDDESLIDQIFSDLDLAEGDYGSAVALDKNAYDNYEGVGAFDEYIFDQPDLSMPEITDLTDYLRFPLMSGLIDTLGAANPYDTRRDEILTGQNDRIDERFNEARENLINRFGVMGHDADSSPLFLEQLRKLENDRALAKGDIMSQFGQLAAGTDESIRRNRLSDISSALGGEFNRVQTQMANQAGLQDQANQGMSNFMAGSQASWMDPFRDRDEGYRLALGGIGSLLQPNVGAAVTGLGNIASTAGQNVANNSKAWGGASNAFGQAFSNMYNQPPPQINNNQNNQYSVGSGYGGYNAGNAPNYNTNIYDWKPQFS